MVQTFVILSLNSWRPLEEGNKDESLRFSLYIARFECMLYFRSEADYKTRQIETDQAC